MRNLKRALSLAMASVMLLGMMVVGTSASYKDVDADKNNVEAIEVLQKVGIMVGDENGNFNPDNLVTRQEMAVVMSNLMDYRVASYAGTAPFGDVADWAEPYVAACYTNGITSGMGANYYGATENVTTSQAALMLMKALGYFQFQSDFGADWQLATTKQANKIDLFDGVESGVKEAMTRNDLAQLVLNALEAGTVEADNDTIKVEADNVKVEAGSVKYNYLTSGKKYAEAIDKDLTTGTGTASSNTEGSIIQLGEKLYNGDLKKDDTGVSTGFKAPATKWTYKSEVIGTYADDADFIFTGEVKSSVMYDAVGEDAAEDYTWATFLNGEEGTSITPEAFKKAVVADNNAGLKDTGRGTTTYVYIDDEGTGKVTVCIVESFAAEVIQVDDETITLDDATGALEFDIDGYEEDTVVIYTKSYDADKTTDKWTVEDVLCEATYVEGTVDQVKDKDTVIIDGKTYKYNTTVESDKITIDSYDQTVGFYLDAQGHIALVDDAVESGDYAFVLNVYGDDAKYGSNDVTVYAKMVLADGTVVKVELDDDCYDEGDDAETTVDNAKGDFNRHIVTYTVDDDGLYSLIAKTELTDVDENDKITKKGVSGIQNISESTVYGDSNTVYLVCEDEDDDEYAVYQGYKSVPDIEGATATKGGLVAKNGVAKFVYITDAATKIAADDLVFVIGRSNEAPIKATAGNYYEYKAIVNGETTTIKVKDTIHDEFKALMATETKEVDGEEVTSIIDKQIMVLGSITVNSKGLVTDFETIDAAIAEDDDLAYLGEFTGIRRANSSGLIGFGYKSAGEYNTYLGAEDDAIVAYYEPSGNTLSAVGTTADLYTDTTDLAYVVTYDGSVIAVIVKVQPN